MGKTWNDIARGEKQSLKQKEGLQVSVNDIRDKYFNGEKLSEEERKALSRFDDYRIWYLNSADGELEFHRRYEELQVLANLATYTDFLDQKYDLPKQ